ncbi:hypothetical protein DY052_05900 [Apilactobacillus timberlakei]|uniref:hypothetical protein n=1 Tax=Apilactobacillus timberlakei TaxID=2008380 RepID=UPI0011283BD6|nr:hypothetical protein [Apilactobacillus timberlakei]TPR14956.1 hypothetical protein DY052_05900 [Apilactobacillus timberlakei]
MKRKNKKKHNKLLKGGLFVLALTGSISIPLVAYEYVHASTKVVNNKLTPITKDIGNTKFGILDSIDNDLDIKTNGNNLKSELISSPNNNESSILGNKVMRVYIPNKMQSGSKITLIYHNGARYGNQQLTTKLTISNLNLYPNNSKMGNLNNRRYIDISPNLSKGLFYYGLTKAHAHYAFYTDKGANNIFNIGSQSDPSYMTFNSLNGVDSNTSHQALDNRVGEWVRYVNGDDEQVPALGYISNNSQIGNLPINKLTGIPGEKGVGGKSYTPFHDSQKGDKKSFETHSVTFPAFNKNYQDFEFGASYGSAWYTLSTMGLEKQPDKPKPKEKEDFNDNGEKTVSKSEIKKSGDSYYYTIKGTLPEKHKTYKTNYYQVPEQASRWIVDEKRKGGGYWEQYTKYVTHSYDEETNTHDSYNITDNVPKDVSVTNVSAKGIQQQYNSGSNNLSFKANNNWLLTHSNRDYEIRIDVKADKLPQPDKDGWHDKGVHDKGWYYINNKASVSGTSYSNNFSHDTNNVHTRIKRIQGVVYHYNWDSDESGDFGFVGNYNNAKDSNFNLNDNLNEDNGIIKKEMVYGYNNDKKNVSILKDAYKDNNTNWKYRYVYGNQDKEEITLKDDLQGGGDDYQFSRDYFFPYIVPRASISNSVIKIDTDKGKNGLPFQIIMNATSDMYREYDNYSNSQVNIDIVDDKGNKLYQITKPLSSLLSDNQGGSSYTKISGRLDTNKLNLPKGTKLGVNVNINHTNPNAIQIDHDDTDKTFGFTSSENTLVGNKDTNVSNTKKDGNPLNDKDNTTYFKKDENSYTAPERTMKYDNVDSVRVLDEQLKLQQNRYSSAKTGFGMKNDLSMSYRGNLNAEKYMNDGTGINYVFPNQFIGNTNIRYSKDAHNHKYNDELMNTDRLQQVNKYESKDHSFADLDNTKDMDGSDQQTIEDIDNNIPSNLKNENYGEFTTDYKFYPRVAEYNSGNVDLAKDVTEPRPSNYQGYDTAYNFFSNADSRNQFNNNQFRDGGNKFYTPYWLKFGNYPVYYNKVNSSDSDKEQLGGNWLNIDDLRPTNFYAHAYLSAQSDSGINEKQDQISFQPILSQNQKVQGFNNFENKWLYYNFDK